MNNNTNETLPAWVSALVNCADGVSVISNGNSYHLRGRLRRYGPFSDKNADSQKLVFIAAKYDGETEVIGLSKNEIDVQVKSGLIYIESCYDHHDLFFNNAIVQKPSSTEVRT